MKLPKLIGYYTEKDKNNFYVECFKKLEKQCIEFGFDYYFEKKPSFQNYVKNCKIKPKFILECLNKFKESLIFIDIDSNLTGSIPEELNNLKDYDIAISKTWNEPNPNQEIELNNFKNKKSFNANHLLIRDGFLFVNNTEKAIEFIKNWDHGCSTFHHTDHLVLDYCIKKHIEENKTKIKILSGFVNCCPTIDKIGVEELRADKEELLKNNRVFCFYGVSGSGR
jgi:hypothetical protein